MRWIQRFLRAHARWSALALVCLGLVPALSPCVAQAQQKHVFVLSVQGVKANEEIREGLREGLKWGGFFEGKTFRLTFEEAPAEQKLLKELALKAVIGRPDALVAIAPSAIQAVVATTRQYPVVYVNVSDPADALALKPEEITGSNVTGLSNVIQLSRQVATIKQLVPQARKVGVIYNPGDPVSVAKVKELQEQMVKAGLAMLETSAHRASDVGAAARSLIGRVDALYTFDDANVTKSYAALVRVANDAKLPLIASTVSSVRQGAAAAVVVTDRDLGVQAGKMLSRVLRGASPASIQPEAARPMLMLNLPAAQKQGVVISEALMKSAGEILR